MKPILITKKTLFNETASEFIEIPETSINIEHSLVSISKWESIFKKPFLKSLEDKTISRVELLSYVKCMTLNKNINETIYLGLSNKNIDDIFEYMNDKMSATWFREEDDKNTNKRQRPITAELIYCWMIQNNIPKEFEKWHLNRLITLIRVCQEENKPPKEFDKKTDMSKRRALMEQRRAKSRAKRH